MLGSAMQMAGTLNRGDDAGLFFGSGKDAAILYETADANAKALIFALPQADEDANNVPVAIFGDRDIVNVDLGMFNSRTYPSAAVIDIDQDSYFELTYAADDTPIIRSNRAIEIRANGTATYKLGINGSANATTLFGYGAYLRVGDAAATSHSLASEDDLMVSGKLEVDGIAYFDSSIFAGANQGVAAFGPGAVSSITIVNGIVTAIS